jgi:hypothetical protein
VCYVHQFISSPLWPSEEEADGISKRWSDLLKVTQQVSGKAGPRPQVDLSPMFFSRHWGLWVNSEMWGLLMTPAETSMHPGVWPPILLLNGRERVWNLYKSGIHNTLLCSSRTLSGVCPSFSQSFWVRREEKTGTEEWVTFQGHTGNLTIANVSEINQTVPC